MSRHRHRKLAQSVRGGLILLGLTAAGCDGVVDPDRTPGISLSVTPTTMTVQRGRSQAVTLTLVRAGGFRGSVDFSVTGAPPGVTATVSNVQGTRALTTATITVLVDAVVAPTTFPLVVHATSSGVSEATATLPVSVGEPSYSFWLSASALTITQGWWSSWVTVQLTREFFTGVVHVSVENLPTGVLGYVSPSDLAGNSSWQLGFYVPPGAPVGRYTDIRVRGMADGLTDRTASFTLEILTAPFVLTLSSPELTTARGAAALTTVNVVRNGFAGPVTLIVDIGDSHGTMPDGITAEFGVNPTIGETSVLTLAVSASALPGVYHLWVYAVTPTGGFDGIPLTLTVTAP